MSKLLNETPIKKFNWVEENNPDQIIVTGKVTSASSLVNETGCNTCPNNYPLTFRDVPSYREYKIAGMCQSCQDEVFPREESKKTYRQSNKPKPVQLEFDFEQEDK